MGVQLLLAEFCGLLFTLCAYWLCRQPVLSLLSGLLFFLILFLFLRLHRARQDRNYAEFEKTITSPVFFRTEGNFRTDSGVRYGRVYFCEDGILCISLETEPPVLDQLLPSDIEAFQFQTPYFYIHASDGRSFCLTGSDTEAMAAALKEKGWIS